MANTSSGMDAHCLSGWCQPPAVECRQVRFLPGAFARVLCLEVPMTWDDWLQVFAADTFKTSGPLNPVDLAALDALWEDMRIAADWAEERGLDNHRRFLIWVGSAQLCPMESHRAGYNWYYGPTYRDNPTHKWSNLPGVVWLALDGGERINNGHYRYADAQRAWEGLRLAYHAALSKGWVPD